MNDLEDFNFEENFDIRKLLGVLSAPEVNNIDKVESKSKTLTKNKRPISFSEVVNKTIEVIRAYYEVFSEKIVIEEKMGDFALAPIAVATIKEDHLIFKTTITPPSPVNDDLREVLEVYLRGNGEKVFSCLRSKKNGLSLLLFNDGRWNYYLLNNVKNKIETKRNDIKHLNKMYKFATVNDEKLFPFVEVPTEDNIFFTSDIIAKEM